MNQIKQSEFAESHKLTPGEVRELRNTHLKEGEDWVSGGPTNRTIFWTDEAARRIESILSGETSPPTEDFPEAPEFVEVRVNKIARNPKFVYGDLNGMRIAIFAGKHANRIVGKKVKAAVSIIEGETRYIYQP